MLRLQPYARNAAAPVLRKSNMLHAYTTDDEIDQLPLPALRAVFAQIHNAPANVMPASQLRAWARNAVAVMVAEAGAVVKDAPPAVAAMYRRALALGGATLVRDNDYMYGLAVYLELPDHAYHHVATVSLVRAGGPDAWIVGGVAYTKFEALLRGLLKPE